MNKLRITGLLMVAALCAPIHGQDTAADAQRTASDAARQTFFNEYEPQTKIYALRYMSAKTAHGLIQGTVDNYGLFADGGRYRSLSASEARRMGIQGAPLAEAPSSSSFDERANTVVVMGPAAMQKAVGDLLAQIDRPGSVPEGGAGQGIRPFRLELALVRGSTTRRPADESSIRIFNRSSGVVVKNSVQEGRRVKKGEMLLELENRDVKRKLADVTGELNLADEQMKLAEEQGRSAKQRFEAGLSSENEMQDAARQAMQFKAEAERARRMAADLQESLKDLVVVSPADGVLAEGPESPGVNERIEASRLLATIRTGDAPATGTLAVAAAPPAEVAALGLTQADLTGFGIASTSLLGKSIISLGGAEGPLGHSQTMLGEDYRCTVDYIESRDPFLVVRVELAKWRDDGGVTILGNTVFLEAGKPTLIGVTNLKEALLLVLRREREGNPGTPPAPVRVPAQP